MNPFSFTLETELEDPSQFLSKVLDDDKGRGEERGVLSKVVVTPTKSGSYFSHEPERANMDKNLCKLELTEHLCRLDDNGVINGWEKTISELDVLGGLPNFEQEKKERKGL